MFDIKVIASVMKWLACMIEWGRLWVIALVGHTKDYEIGIICFSVNYTALRSKQRTVGSESG